MHHSKRQSRRFALLYMDLDKFKPVNDALGHQAGDELLQAVAKRIRKQVRDSDTVARVGGDEFTVILADVATREGAQSVAVKIAAAIVPPFQLGERKRSVAVGVSIGIALYPPDALDADALVKLADAGMYDAKKTAGSFRPAQSKAAERLPCAIRLSKRHSEHTRAVSARILSLSKKSLRISRQS